MRKIALFLDGTWNTPESYTNVYTLYEQTHGIAARKLDPNHESLDKQQQIKYYDKGVGTSVFSQILGGAFGLGLSENIHEAYKFLCIHYQPADEIYIFGFSRGSYTARSLVGFINMFGLLTRENATDANIKEALNIYKQRNEEENKEKKAKDILDNHSFNKPKIRFLGVWDTVGALGIPKSFWGDKFPWLWKIFGLEKKEMHDTTLSSIVENAYHAVAIDEHRPDFNVTLWDKKQDDNTKVEQCWFCGAHANIGGGYQDNKLNKIPFDWMKSKAMLKGKGLIFFHSNDVNINELTLEPVVDSYKQFFFNIYGLLNPLFKKIGIGRKPEEIQKGNNKDKEVERIVREFRTDRNYREINLDDKETMQTLHPSVLIYCKNNENYRPPNLPIDQLKLRFKDINE